MEAEYHKPYAISVIVPIYNVRNYIARCVKSLMEQTLDNVEYIFVDDASPDDSVCILRSVLERYPNRKDDVLIISHEENKGLPAARNTGLSQAVGEYVFHCDSDDFVELSMLEEMYECAENNAADIIWADWYLSLPKMERYMSMKDCSTPLDAIRMMLSGGMKYNVWNKLVRRSLYSENDINFPSGYGMGEDLTIIKLFAFAKKAIHLPKAYYHYNKTNTAAFSQTYSDRHLEELHHNIEDLTRFIKEKLGQDYEKEIAFLKLEAKFPFLLSPDARRIKLWKYWYPESNEYIKYNSYISSKNRMLQQLAAKNFWLVVRAYNFLFNKIIYGIIYR